MITEKTGVLAPIPENIPVWLSARRQWVVWCPEQRSGKLEKVPYSAEGGVRTDANDSLSWITFEDAVEAYRSSGGFYGGIGFCFASCDPFVGIDLDGCRNPETAEIKLWAQKIIDRVREGYIEISPSGEGVHIIVEGKVRDGGRSRRKVHLDGGVVGEIEMYSRSRFFAITGGVV